MISRLHNSIPVWFTETEMKAIMLLLLIFSDYQNKHGFSFPITASKPKTSLQIEHVEEESQKKQMLTKAEED